MKATTIMICFFLILTNFGCAVNKLDVDSYKGKFQANKKGFDTLVQLLKEQTLRVGYSINENELPDNIQTILDELEISDVNLDVTQCQGITGYQFTSSWSSKATLNFSKNTCDKDQTVQGYHAKISEMIEVWGLGDGWSMWIDHDFI
jgi:hypothetical protein